MSGLATAGFRIEPLSPEHDRSSFRSGESALDDYLQRQARQDNSRHIARIYVLTCDGKAVDGFYSLSATSIDPTSLPEENSRKLPRFGIPATLLGRMAIDSRRQGQSLGNLLLVSALRKAWEGSRLIASWAVVVDAKKGARDFYLRRDFLPFPDHPDRLFLTLSHIARLLSGLAIAE
jgi:GNAT superfamily N-acetyltransferase